jgi:hypothetical protein
MLQASLRELIEEGRLGSLTLQKPRGIMRAALGDPDDFSTILNSDGQPMIWKYGDIEFHFDDDGTLWLIHTDTFPMFPRGGRKLRLDPWIFRHSLTSAALIGICQQLRLPCREFVAPWMGPEERRFLVGVGVEVSFAIPEGKRREQLTAVSYAQFRWASEGKYFVTQQTGNESNSQQ